MICGSPIREEGRRIWKTYEDIDLETETFPQIGAELEQQGKVIFGKIGLAETRLFSQRAAVDFATEWLTRHSQTE